MPFISYAQNYEDVMLWRALRDVKGGFYVDVGAADPKEDSVTCAFYERGWSGINIEPLDGYFEKLVQERPRDTNLKVMVGKEPGVRTLYSFPGTGLSTFDPEISARHEQAGFVGQKVLVPVLTLTKILQDCAPPTIHFLKVDVEGAEAEVLEGLDLDRARPWIITVESTRPNSTVISRDKWEYLLTEHGYGIAYFDGLNDFYVADEHSRLKEHFAAPPNVFDDFVRWREWHLADHAESLEKRLEIESLETAKLNAAFQAEMNHTNYLRNVLAEERALTANLRNALTAERAAWLAKLDSVSSRIESVRAQLAFPWFVRAVGHVFEGLHQTGDRLTGGGIRAAASRVLKASLCSYLAFAGQHKRLTLIPRVILKPFPKFTAALYRFAVPPTPETLSPQGQCVPSEDPPVPPEHQPLALEAQQPPSRPLPPEDPIRTLPASARSTYLKLKTVVSREGTSPNAL
jgi:FkbM family methyltransferase